MSKKYRIIEKQYADGKGEFGKPHWYVQELKKNWFGYSRWRYITEKVCYTSGCYDSQIRFDSWGKAEAFIDNILCKDIKRNHYYEKIVSEYKCKE